MQELQEKLKHEQDVRLEVEDRLWRTEARLKAREHMLDTVKRLSLNNDGKIHAPSCIGN